jgi:kelch-like protein 1/4/5
MDTYLSGSRRIPAHRLVLSAGSEYFAAMFTSDLCEKTQNEVVLQGVDGDALSMLVHYCYTGIAFMYCISKKHVAY